MKKCNWLWTLAGVAILTGAAVLASAAVPDEGPGTPGFSDNPDPAPRETPATQPAGGYKVLQERPDRLFIMLPDRMLAIIQEVHTAPVVSVQMWIKTGSVYEQEHVGAGLSHFLEHLLAGGSTTTRTQEETRKMLGQLGAEFNASTGMDAVNYHINTTTNNGNAATAVGLISDWMQNSLITPREYQREGQVIQREFDLGEGSPGRVLWTLMQQAGHKFHPSRHPTIGYIADFLSITRKEIYEFYRRMYVPNNMVMVVVGDVDKKAIADQIATLWADKPAGTLPKLSFPIETPISEPRAITGIATVTSPRLTLAWPGTRMDGPHDHAADLLAAILGQGELSRLMGTVRDRAGAVTSIDAGNESFSWGEGFFTVDCAVAMPRPAGPPATQPAGPEEVKAAVARAQALILEQVNRVRDGGVTAEELARAKRQIISSIVMSSQSADGLARRLAGDVMSSGDPDHLTHYGESIQRVTAAEVQDAAKAILQPQRLIAITLIPPPGKEKIVPFVRPPAEPMPADMKTEPVDLDNNVLMAKFETLSQHRDAEPAAPPVEVGQIHVHKLSNGLRVLVQRNTLVPVVSIQLYELGGLLADDVGKEGIANAAASMLGKGTATRDAGQIAQEIEGLGADMSYGGGGNTVYIRSECLKSDWPTILELTADTALHPTFPDKEWAYLRPRLAARIDRERDNWGGELFSRFREVYYGPESTWSQSATGRKSVVEAATAQDLARFYHDHLGASQAVLAVFGDVDEDKVVSQAEKLFASMPAEPARPFVVPHSAPPTAGLRDFLTNKSVVGVVFGFGPAPRRQEPDFADVQVLTHVLSAFPAGWLEEELRGSKGPGLVYATGAFLSTGLIPGFVGIEFNTQPSTAAEALKRTESVIHRATDTRVDAATLSRAKAAVLTEEFFGKQTNADRAADAALNELYGLGLDAPKKFLDRVDRLDAGDLQTVARKYLRNPVVVIISHDELPTPELNAALTADTVPTPDKKQ